MARESGKQISTLRSGFLGGGELEVKARLEAVDPEGLVELRERRVKAWLQHAADQTGLSFREEGPAGPEELRLLLARDAQPGERTNWLQQLQPPSRQRSAAATEEVARAEGASGRGSCPGSPTPGSPGAHDAEAGGMSRGLSNPVPGQTLGLRQRKGAGGDGGLGAPPPPPPPPLAIEPPPPPPVLPSKKEQRATAREASLTQPTPEARHFTPAGGWIASAWPAGVELPPNMLPLLPAGHRLGLGLGSDPNPKPNPNPNRNPNPNPNPKVVCAASRRGSGPAGGRSGGAGWRGAARSAAARSAAGGRSS